MTIVCNEYARVVYQYKLEIDDKYIKVLNETIKNALGNEQEYPEITEDLLGLIMSGNYIGEDDIVITVDGNWKMSYFEYVNDIVRDDIWCCNSEVIDQNTDDADYYVYS